MTLRLAVDAERLLHDYLSTQTDVVAKVSTRVYTQLPDSPVFPLVVLKRIAGTWRDRERLDRPMIQIETWADKGARQAAHDAMATVRAALVNDAGLFVKAHTLGVVTGVEEVQGPSWLPDAPTGRARFIFTVQVFLHP